MSIDENLAYEITKRLSFPRLVGSEGEKRAIKVVVDEFEKMGYNTVNREKFKTSLNNWKRIELLFLTMGILYILLAISYYNLPILSLVIITLIVICILKLLKISDSNKIKLMKNDIYNFETENIYVNLKSKNSLANLIFIAHYDSKSQVYSSIFRIYLIMGSVFGGIILLVVFFVLSVLKIIFMFNNLILDNILLGVSIVIGILTILNFFNKVSNKSPGATDNATSVGTVIALSKYFKNNALENIDFTFLITGSEELNLGGAIDFIQKHKNELDKDITYFINYDLVGAHGVLRNVTSHGIPKKTTSTKLNELFRNSSKDLGIEIKEIYFPIGAAGDHMPIVNMGYKACVLASTGSMKYVHSKKDTMSLVSKEGLNNIFSLSIEVANRLNKELT
ncbi:MAG: hypothetical protein CEE42_01500 [Promethearchaeota archaeon Loki_b31]|nr:MAG: hypothetical protein CEE42_01500 [Candidatus Lokiarchaeota archaeon Loki_b31]